MKKSEEFDRQVVRYEKLRDVKDKFSSFRKHLLKDISGSVLEIAPGPGFNFKHYKNIDKLTAVDLSPKMIESAKKKWETDFNKEADFIVADLESMNFPENSFDSVISTCSLCAYNNPVEVLNKLSKWCKPSGKIYLLEHGLSDNMFMRFIQNLYNPIHHKIHTCHCNRDMREIVSESNLEVVSLKKPRPHAPIDFLYEIVAKPLG